MLFNIRYITLAALFAVVVSQQPPQCVLECSQAALASATNKSCKAITDPCVCDDTGFQTADGACLQANCTTSDQEAAAQLQDMFCGGSNTTTTESYSSTKSAASTSMSMSGSMSGSMSSMTTTKGSSTGTSSSSTASTTTKNAASAQAELGLFTLGVAAAGAVVGGLLL